MRLLVIETAADACSVALSDDAVVVAYNHHMVGRGHAEALLPMIAALPEGGRADAVAVDVGPGSFTGVRVGLAAARALGLAWAIPVHGYGALELLAAGEDACIVVVPGGHGEWFVQRFASGASLAPPQSLTPAKAIALADQRVIGAAASAFVALRGFGQAVMRVPDARTVAQLPEAARALPPAAVYCRAADAKAMINVPAAC
jgi:tRNA threonylcarbamoyladenosine biosynthesis protein TsaB